jgi:type I restriction enzyme S subunit
LPSEVAADYLLDDGDLLFARSGATVGKCYYYDGSGGPACFAGYLIKASAKPTKLSARFLYHFTNSPQYSSWRDSTFVQATIENIGARRYGYLPVPLPPLPEQKRIAAYLDASCAVIDRVVETKQKQLETLDLLRKSIIQRAVTQGLNPEIEMRNSGVDWLGNVPKHWRVAKMKRLLISELQILEEMETFVTRLFGHYLQKLQQMLH